MRRTEDEREENMKGRKGRKQDERQGNQRAEKNMKRKQY